ncbi:MAG TPA: S8 family serine peptidase [Casimicrobiaceae bacterium]|nr:S8 family serine peptidase [Casimicrobiaceae bacterium]
MLSRSRYVATLVLLTIVSSGTAAQVPGRFSRATQPVANTHVLPASLSHVPRTIVVVLGGDSVAQRQAAAGRKLTQQEKEAIKSQRRIDQQAVIPLIQASGGTILNTFQSALNGVKVKIARDRIDALRQIPGVIDVRPVVTYRHENTVGIPRIQAPAAWAGVPGFRGEGVKIAIIDTGIDYTHADFGGPGTEAAFQTAAANSTAPADPSLFGPGAPKVKGGTDLVGDAYDADDPDSVPQPDPNPLDCAGHGSHVAGTAAGFGVLANGTTYSGPYDLTTETSAFLVGPGVAPLADLYAVRVFGCSGSTNVIVDALDWAVDNDMDVVNMSLGTNFAPGDSADALASDSAVKAGIIVVAAAGNDGDIRYIVASPGDALKGIGVAAAVTPASLPAVNLALPSVGATPAQTIGTLDANAASVTSATLTAVVLKDASQPGGVSLGCDPAEYLAANVTGKLVVTQRGTCARVDRVIYGQTAGAAAVAMINNAPGLPPFEGSITENPDTGQPFLVDIPFLGVDGLVTTAGSDGAALIARDGLPVGLSGGPEIPTGLAVFSSGGPRLPDGLLKPDVTAPGDPIVSVLVGSGTQGTSDSGTSMATPHVAGTSALGRQAHPAWTAGQVKSAVINSATPGAIAGYVAHNAGAGLVNAASVAHTQVIASADDDATTLNFGVVEFTSDLNKGGKITLRNDGSTDASFNVTVEQQQGSPHNVVLGASLVKVKAHSTSAVRVSLNVPAATAGDSTDFRDVAGLVTFTPVTASDNAGVALRVPYYLVSRVSANLSANLSKKIKAKSLTANMNLANKGSSIPGTADFYAWGLQAKSSKKNHIVDLDAAGVQSYPSPDGQVLVFAVNDIEPWSTPERVQFDVNIDVNGDGVADFSVFNIDAGLLDADPEFNGQMVVAVFDLKANAITAVDFFAFAPTDSATMLLPVLAADVGVTPANPRFSYTVESFDFFGTASDSFTTSASFNAFSSSITNGNFVVVPPNSTASVPVSVNSAEWAITPALGFMIVTPDNRNGPKEVNLVGVSF